jgi:hypothetical protein
MTRSRRFSPPFKDLIGNEVNAGAWHYRSDDGTLLLVDGSIPGWDYLKNLELHREVEVDGARVAGTCDLPAGATFSLVVTAHSPSARFRRIVFRSNTLQRKQEKIAIRFELSGVSLSKEVRLEMEILLVHPVATKSPFVATLPGSRLYGDILRIDLEGSGSRMPIEIADLTNQIPGLTAPHASWHVLMETSDLHAPTMRSLRVFLNSAERRVIDAMQAGDKLMLSLLGADVARRVLSAAIEDDDFIANPDDYEEGSIGEAAQRLLRLCFPGQSPSNVRAVAASNPARYESAIQSCTRLTDV